MDVRDAEREEERTNGADRRASRDMGTRLAEDDGGYVNAVSSQSSRPWGFWLVLAAIVVVAVMYSVTMIVLRGIITNPATAIGALSGAFAVIGTLVGTYFGIKAGLDGQEKAKETMDKAIRGEESRRELDRNRERERERERERQRERNRGGY